MTGPDKRPPILAGRRVLIVEDRYLIASDLEAEVRELAGEVIGPVRSVELGLHSLAAERFDLALLDINLDGETAYPLAQALSDAGKPFLFVTGYDDWALPPEWREWPRLRKPVNRTKLFNELARLCAIE